MLMYRVYIRIKKVSIDKETMNDGSTVYHLDLSGTLIRYTFTEI